MLSHRVDCPPCGPEEARTPDLYSAIVALSQLSYRPINESGDILAYVNIVVKHSYEVYTHTTLYHHGGPNGQKI